MGKQRNQGEIDGEDRRCEMVEKVGMDKQSEQGTQERKMKSRKFERKWRARKGRAKKAENGENIQEQKNRKFSLIFLSSLSNINRYYWNMTYF
jgi:hypothetical protein